jgi:hypothetical protein
MTINLLTEDLIGLAALAARIKSHRRKGHVTAQCAWRWATVGVRCTDGTVAKLETVRLAGRFLTSWPAFLRFLEAQSGSAPAQLPVVAHRSPRKRDRASARAAQDLASAGI